MFRLVHSLEVCGKMDNLPKLTAAGILISGQTPVIGRAGARYLGRISGLPNIWYITNGNMHSVNVVECATGRQYTRFRNGCCGRRLEWSVWVDGDEEFHNGYGFEQRNEKPMQIARKTAQCEI